MIVNFYSDRPTSNAANHNMRVSFSGGTAFLTNMPPTCSSDRFYCAYGRSKQLYYTYYKYIILISSIHVGNFILDPFY